MVIIRKLKPTDLKATQVIKEIKFGRHFFKIAFHWRASIAFSLGIGLLEMQKAAICSLLLAEVVTRDSIRMQRMRGASYFIRIVEAPFRIQRKFDSYPNKTIIYKSSDKTLRIKLTALAWNY